MVSQIKKCITKSNLNQDKIDEIVFLISSDKLPGFDDYLKEKKYANNTRYLANNQIILGAMLADLKSKQGEIMIRETNNNSKSNIKLFETIEYDEKGSERQSVNTSSDVYRPVISVSFN